MQLSFLFIALAVSQATGSLLSDAANLTTPQNATDSASRSHAGAKPEVRVVIKYQTTLATVARITGSTLSAAQINVTTPGGATRSYSTEIPAQTVPYHCVLFNCDNEIHKKAREKCIKDNIKACNRGWKSVQSKVWETSSMVEDGLGPNARKTPIKYNSNDFSEWSARMTKSPSWIAPRPTVDIYSPEDSFE